MLKGRYYHIVLYSAYSDLKTEISRRFLGFLWWVLEPLLFMMTFYVIFGFIFKQEDGNFVSFLLAGLVPWKWFDGSIRHAMTSISVSQGLLQQIYVPKYVLPLVCTLTSTVKFFFIFTVLVVFILYNGYALDYWFYLVPVILCQFIMTFSVGLMFSAILPFAEDLKIIFDNLMMLVMFASGIFYRTDGISIDHLKYFSYNPIYILIDSFRTILLHNNPPDLNALFFSLIISIIIGLIGLMVILRQDRHYPKLVG